MSPTGRFLHQLQRRYGTLLNSAVDALHHAAERLDRPERRSALLQLQDGLRRMAHSAGLLELEEVSARATTLKWTVDRWLYADAEIGTAKKIRFMDRLDALLDGLPVQAQTGRDAADSDPHYGELEAGARIGLLEDDPALGEVLEEALQAAGVRVDRLSGPDGLADYLADCDPHMLVVHATAMNDAVFSDQVSARVACPVLLLSEDDDFLARLYAARPQALGHLCRPTRPGRLLRQIEAFAGVRQENPFRILLLGRDSCQGARYTTVLGDDGMIVEEADTPESLIARIATFQPDLVLLDSSDGTDARELMRVIRFSDAFVAPAILVVCDGPEGDGVAWGERGPDLSLSRSCDSRQLSVAVRILAERSRQVSEMLTHDRLTGVLNRARISEELDIEIAKAQRASQPLAVAMLDLDELTRINVEQGHAVGDEVIRQLAGLLETRLRRSDRVGRYGGDKFLAILPNCSHFAAGRLINEIRELFRKRGGQNANVEGTLSAGISASTEVGWDELMVAAEQALQSAKDHGRNRVFVGAGSTAAEAG